MLCLELDALGDELEFEDEDVPSYLQETPDLDLPKTAETDLKSVSSIYKSFYAWSHLCYQDPNVKLDEFGLPITAEGPMKA